MDLQRVGLSMILLALGCGLAGLGNESTAQPADLPDEDLIEYSANGWNLVIAINGMPLTIEENGGGRTGIPMGYERAKKQNVLTINAKKIGKTRDRPKLSLIRRSKGNEEQLGTIDFRDGADEVSSSMEFAGAPTAKWAFEAAEKIGELKEKDRSEILSSITAFFSAIKENRVDAVMQMRAVAAHVANEDNEKQKKEQREQMKELFNSFPVVELKPPDAIQMRAMELGVIVTSTGGPHDWMMRQRDPKDENLSIVSDKLVFAKMNGKWTMVK